MCDWNYNFYYVCIYVCMYQDATWCGGRPRPWPHCVRWGSSCPQMGHKPQFLTHVCCGQMAGWIKMLLGTEVGLGQGDIVLDGDLAPPPQKKRGTAALLFGPCILWPNGRPFQQLLSSCQDSIFILKIQDNKYLCSRYFWNHLDKSEDTFEDTSSTRCFTNSNPHTFLMPAAWRKSHIFPTRKYQFSYF